MFRLHPAWLVCGAWWLLPPFAAAVEPPKGLATAAWRLESVELRDGRRLEGVVVKPEATAGDDDPVVFMQVVRRPGRPMSVITWPPLKADRIRSVNRLPAAEHDALVARVRAFLDGGQRRHDAETAVQLARDDDDGPWRYVGADIELESMADPMITRSAVVALEQVLEGLATLVPRPPAIGHRTIQVRLCGSTAEYREMQRGLGIAIDNPAFYVPARRLLVAGGDLPALVERKRTVDDQLAATEQRYAELDRLLPGRLKDLATDLERQGLPKAQRSEAVQKARHRWERELAAGRERVAATRRANDAELERAHRAFRGRLAHEAWHAYADTRLRPPDGPALPAWLDEGLAQVIESAPLEAGELRLDAPDPARLVLLQDALRSGRVPPLADLLREGQAPFLAGHAAASDAGIAYLAAWGLALDVAMLRPVVSAATIASLRADEDDDPLADFERLVGAAVHRFEAGWKNRILALRPEQANPRAVTPAP